ncbi:MAG TPA: prepilin-type N-terminal cleavage/methylation domain-containing protein [Opitutales bacterium]|nr:prepilin-type N-terminal cleavage/methylation domain-containing protein [Opitutales bacterium]
MRIPKKVSGFTLIELLTVIAIIGILAAILIPVVGRVRDSARTAKCVSNIRTTTTAMISHIEDHGGWLRTMSGGDTVNLWTRTLAAEGYFELRTGGVPSESILCPSGEYRNPAHHFDAYGLNMFDTVGNKDRPEGSSTSFYYRNFNDPDINPSRYILMGDSIRGAPSYRQIFRLASNVATNDGSLAMRHNGKANIGFLDGHVELVGPERVRTFEPELLSGRDELGNDIEFPDPY